MAGIFSRKSNRRISCLLYMDAGATECKIRELKLVGGTWEQTAEFDLVWETSGEDRQSQPARRGLQLRQALEERGLSTKKVYVNCPKNRVLLKRFSLAIEDPELLAAAVLLEAETRGISPDEFAIDFVQYPEDHPLSGEVCVAATPCEVLDNWTQIIEAAGLELIRVGTGHPAPISSGGDLELLLSVDHGQTQALTSIRGFPFHLFTIPHGAEPGGLAEHLVPQVDRLQQAWRSNLEFDSISIQVCGEQAAPIASHLGQRDAYRVSQVFDPHPKDFARQALEVDGFHRFNFSDPKRSPDPNKRMWARTRQRVLVWGLVASLLGLMVRGYCDRLDKQSKALQTEISAAERDRENVQDLLESARQLEAWNDCQLSWSHEIAKLVNRLPSNQRLFVQKLRMERSRANRRGDLTIEGSARTMDDALNFNRQLLAEELGYELRPAQFQQENDVPHYPVSFLISASVLDD